LGAPGLGSRLQHPHAHQLGPNGHVQVFNAAGSVDVIVDVSGYYF
jgi:hypothetical protein